MYLDKSIKGFCYPQACFHLLLCSVYPPPPTSTSPAPLTLCAPRTSTSKSPPGTNQTLPNVQSLHTRSSWQTADLPSVPSIPSTAFNAPLRPWLRSGRHSPPRIGLPTPKGPKKIGPAMRKKKSIINS